MAEIVEGGIGKKKRPAHEVLIERLEWCVKEYLRESLYFDDVRIHDVILIRSFVELLTAIKLNDEEREKVIAEMKRVGSLYEKDNIVARNHWEHDLKDSFESAIEKI